MKRKRFETLQLIKPLKKYVSKLHIKILQEKLSRLKSYNYHVFFIQILPMFIWNIENKIVVGIILRVSKIFQKIVAKAMDLVFGAELLLNVVVILAILEKEMPTLFLSIIVHLTHHLTKELYIHSYVYIQQMYLFERYMKALKNYMTNLAQSKEWIALSF